MPRRILIAAIVLIIVLMTSTLAFSETGTVLVFPFENQTSDRNLDWIGEGISELIIDRLQSEPNLYVFQRDERLAGFEKLGLPETAVVSRATAMTLGWDNGSDRVVTGRFTGTADDFSIYARIVDLTASGASQEITIQGKLEALIPLANTLSWRILKIMEPASRTPESDYTSRPPIPRSAFESYIRGMLSGDPKRRAELFEDAIRLHPQYSAALFQLGRLKHLEGDFKESTQRLEKLKNSDSDYLYAQFLIGLNDYRLGDYTKAAAVFSSMPSTYDVLDNLGAALSSKGETLSAISAWRRASDRDPYAMEAVFNVGYANFMKGDMEAAVKSLDQALRLQGRDGETLFLLARAYERLGRIEDSQKAMTQATRISPRLERWLTQPMPKLERLKLTPNIAELRRNGTLILWSPERLSRRAKGQELTAWLEFIQTQVDSQLYGEASRELKIAMQVYPNSSDTHILMAQVHERQRNYDQAVAEYEASIRLRPSAEAYVAQARAYRSLNQLSLALRSVQEALKLEPDHAAAKALRIEIEKQRQPRGKRG